MQNICEPLHVACFGGKKIEGIKKMKKREE
jgi:hypothetical protein